MSRPTPRRTAGSRPAPHPGDHRGDAIAAPAGGRADGRRRSPTRCPSYAGALTGPMGENIRTAVQLALGGFISLASRSRGADPRTPAAPAVEGAYQLGRGEARSGRSVDALLAAYRIGARVSWREMSAHGGAQRASTPTPWPASPSWSSPTSTSCPRRASPGTPTSWTPPAGSGSGCSSGWRTTCSRARRRRPCSPPPSARAGTPPETLTAVVVPEAHVRPLLGSLAAETLQAAEDLPGLEERVLLLVPDADGRKRAALLRLLRDRERDRRPGAAVAGGRGPRSTGRCGRSALGGTLDTEEHLVAAGADRRRGRARRPAGPGARAAGRRSVRPPPRSWPTRCAPGCCTTAAATRSRPSCSCTRRPCATAWASCASCTATASTTRTRCWS